MHKLITAIVLSVALYGCSTVPVSSDAITCTSKLDKSLDFSYYPKDAQQWHSEEYNVNVYLINAIGGKQIAINSLELENYVCK